MFLVSDVWFYTKNKCNVWVVSWVVQYIAYFHYHQSICFRLRPSYIVQLRRARQVLIFYLLYFIYIDYTVYLFISVFFMFLDGSLWHLPNEALKTFCCCFLRRSKHQGNINVSCRVQPMLLKHTKLDVHLSNLFIS